MVHPLAYFANDHDDIQGQSLQGQLEPCETCDGGGRIECDNPDHGFIFGPLGSVGPGDIGRIGCPGCGHSGMRPCDDCNGTGHK